MKIRQEWFAKLATVPVTAIAVWVLKSFFNETLYWLFSLGLILACSILIFGRRRITRDSPSLLGPDGRPLEGPIVDDKVAFVAKIGLIAILVAIVPIWHFVWPAAFPIVQVNEWSGSELIEGQDRFFLNKGVSEVLLQDGRAIDAFPSAKLILSRSSRQSVTVINVRVVATPQKIRKVNEASLTYPIDNTGTSVMLANLPENGGRVSCKLIDKEGHPFEGTIRLDDQKPVSTIHINFTSTVDGIFSLKYELEVQENDSLRSRVIAGGESVVIIAKKPRE